MLDKLALDYAALEKRLKALEGRGVDIITLTKDFEDFIKRVSFLESKRSTPPSKKMKLIGGWRLRNTEPLIFSRGSIAIDFEKMTLYMVGHAQRNEVYSFNLPKMSKGADPSKWPEIFWYDKLIPAFWNDDGYANGLCWWQGKLWASIRKFYDMKPPSTSTIWALDGSRLQIPLPRQHFNGFVKLGPGQKPFFGCGGYESGQGAILGPTLATLEGKPLIYNPGKREKRPASYQVVYEPGGSHEWIAVEPVNGQGFWAADWIGGGGLVLPEGICFWPKLGIGPLWYKWQSDCFANKWETWKYVYDPVTYQLKSYTHEPELSCVCGHEIGPDGLIYLMERDWAMKNYTLKVFEV